MWKQGLNKQKMRTEINNEIKIESRSLFEKKEELRGRAKRLNREVDHIKDVGRAYLGDK